MNQILNFIEKLYESDLKDSLPDKQNMLIFADKFKIENDLSSFQDEVVATKAKDAFSEGIELDKYIETENKKHWLIRVADGTNFKNSKYPFWGC
jgi:hypothetical protein